MAGKADIEKYKQLIVGLQHFNTGVMESSEKMTKYGQICADLNGNDDMSTKALAMIQKKAAEYRKVVTRSTELQKKLQKEIDNIERLIAEANNAYNHF